MAEHGVRKEELQRPLILLVAARRTEGDPRLAIAQGKRWAESRSWSLAALNVVWNICALVPRQKPRPSITGELCSQPPLGVQATMFPKRSATAI